MGGFIGITGKTDCAHIKIGICKKVLLKMRTIFTDKGSLETPVVIFMIYKNIIITGFSERSNVTIGIRVKFEVDMISFEIKSVRFL